MKKAKIKKSIQKIPEFFIAVEKDVRPDIYTGRLISESETHVVCLAVIDREGSHLKERVLLKSNYKFSSVPSESFRIKAQIALNIMRKEELDAHFEYEAIQAKLQLAESQFNEIFG